MGDRTPPLTAALTLIEAPAGYGKSSLLLRWCAALDAALTPYIFRSFDGNEQDVCWLRDKLSEISPAAGVQKNTPTPVVVIDNWERSSCEARTLFEGAVATGACRWLLASRERIDLPDSVVRNEAPMHVRAAQLDELNLQSDVGHPWPAMSRFDASEDIRAKIPSDQLRQYVRSQVLSVLRADELELLVTLRLFDVIPLGALEFTGHQGATVHQSLREIAERTFLLRPVREGNAQISFCLRNEIRECLRYDLCLRDRAEVWAIKQSTARICRGRGELLRALELSAEIEDWPEVAEMLQEMGIAPLLLETRNRYAAVINRLPDNLRRAYPRLELFCIQVAARQGRIDEAAQRHNDLAQQTANFWRCPAGQDVARLRMDAQIVEFGLAHWAGRTLTKDTMAAFAAFLATAPVTVNDSMVGHLILTMTQYHQGAIGDAVRSLEKLQLLSRTSLSLEVLFGLKLYEIMIAIERCAPHDARRLLEEAFNLIDGNHDKIGDGSLWLQSVEALLEYESANIAGLTDRLEAIRLGGSAAEIPLQLHWFISSMVAACSFEQQGLHAALRYIDDLHNIGVGADVTAFGNLSVAFRVRALLKDGMSQEAIALARHAAIPLLFEQLTYQGDYALVEYVQIALAAMEIALAASEVAEILPLAKVAVTRLQYRGCNLSSIKVALLYAISLYRVESYATAGEIIKDAFAELLSAKFYQVIHEYKHLLEDLLISSIRMPKDFGLDDTAIEQFRFVLALIKADGQPPWLSDRERQIMRKIANGLSNKEIARIECISDNTVKYHLKNINRKFGVSSRSAAVAAAAARGVLESPC